MSDVSPVQYTSRTYQTILNDINAVTELKDKPEWWKRIWAGVGDLLSVYLNAQANNLFLRTAFTRQSVVDLCELIDYALAPKSTASGTQFYNLKSTATFPFTLSVSEQVAQTTGSLTQSAKRYEGRAQILQAAQETGSFTADNTSEELTVSRVFQTGEKVQLTSTGTLPAGLALVTDYWVIRVSDTVIKLASSLVNAKAGTEVTFTDDGTGAHTWHSLTISGAMYQQASVAQYSVGVADGTAEWQELDLADKDILQDTLTVTINSVEWNVLGSGGFDTTFVTYGPTDKVVKLVYNSDLSAKLRFGNGVYGAIPGSFDVFVEYATGGGVDSNASAGQISLYAGGNTDVDATFNAAATTGGSNAESLASAKALAPLLLKARNRFVTVEDGEALVLDYGGISTVRVNKNTYGLLSCQVVCIANGGGNPSAAVRSALQTYLIDRTVLESIDVRVEVATIAATNVTAAVKILGGFTYSAIESYVDLAWKLFLTETGNEIQSEFDSNGIASAVTLINSIFSTTFSSVDYAQVEKLVSNLTPREFGDTIQESDALGYIDSFVNGVDYLTVSAPTFPLTLLDNEITTPGTITLSEIT
jgi:hypothetical protein